MRTTELFRTCVNEHVAGKFERRVAAAARRAGLPAGAFVAGMVADYDRKASPHRRKLLETGMVHDPMPILAGLRHVLETALDGDLDPARDEGQRQNADLMREFSPLPARTGGAAAKLLPWPGGPRALGSAERRLKSLCS